MLLIASTILYLVNLDKKNKIKELNQELQEYKDKEEIVNSYAEDLETIETLKQETAGQENKIKELGEQVQNATDLLVKNKEKRDNMEGTRWIIWKKV